MLKISYPTHCIDFSLYIRHYTILLEKTIFILCPRNISIYQGKKCPIFAHRFLGISQIKWCFAFIPIMWCYGTLYYIFLSSHFWLKCVVFILRYVSARPVFSVGSALDSVNIVIQRDEDNILDLMKTHFWGFFVYVD